MTTETWPDLNTYDTVGLLAHLDYLRKQRAYKEAANLIIEVRAYELRIAAAERMLAIHNRRATEAEDQRAATGGVDPATYRRLAEWLRATGRNEGAGDMVEAAVQLEAAACAFEDHASKLVALQHAVRDCKTMLDKVEIERDAARAEAEDQNQGLGIADVLSEGPLTDEVAWKLIRGLVGGEVAEGRLGNLLAERMLAWMDQRVAEERTLTEDRVREVVRKAIAADHGWMCTEQRVQADAIATRAAKELAGAVVGLSEEDRRALQEWAIDVVFDGPPGPTAGRFVEVEDLSGKSVGVGQWIDRGNGMWALRIPRAHPAQREAVLREAFAAGWLAGQNHVEVGEGVPPSSASPESEVAAAEYARSKAGG